MEYEATHKHKISNKQNSGTGSSIENYTYRYKYFIGGGHTSSIDGRIHIHYINPFLNAVATVIQCLLDEDNRRWLMGRDNLKGVSEKII